MVGQEHTFKSSDLLKYVESLIKEGKHIETKYLNQSNYGWLKSRHNLQVDCTEADLEDLKPLIQKMTPESCTSVAVKLEVLTEQITSTNLILRILKNLLEEEENMVLMAGKVKQVKEMKKKKGNKVYPVLAPRGRQATVSFLF